MTTVWAFAKQGDQDSARQIFESITEGQSRFGWSQEDRHNLMEEWTEWHSRQMFLRRIKPGDWIVHVNCPVWGRCVAVPVIGEYQFDAGIRCTWGTDYRHFIPVDGSQRIEFDRRDPNVLPTVNLNPRQRYHSVRAVDDFLRSIENLKKGSVELQDEDTRELYHLRENTESLLPTLTSLIQSTHRGKNLERLLGKVFKQVPYEIDVEFNGFGWGTDYGADLIVTVPISIGNLELENRIVVQVKSYVDKHYDLSAIDQIKQAIVKYEAVAGMIITTAEKTEQLETAISEAAEQVGRPIDLLAGDDVARFVLQHGHDIIFDLNPSS